MTVFAGQPPAIFTLTKEKRTRYIAEIQGFMTSGICEPSEAASMAGRLCFATACLWGSGPRVFIKPFYRQAEGRSKAIGPALVSAMRWWVEFLNDNVPRIYTRPSTRIGAIAHSDAFLSGLGATVRFSTSERFTTFRTSVPRS